MIKEKAWDNMREKYKLAITIFIGEIIGLLLGFELWRLS